MNGVRAAQDLERKYNLSEVKKNIELADDKIFKVNNELTNFTNSVTSQFEEVQTSIDGKAEIWFYSGAPSLSNLPTSSWEDFFMHIGDLYYDTETGYAYRFKVLEDVYSWEQVQDKDTVESLALANSASDTADSKRRVFLGTPAIPYDIGDLWIYNEELYVCQTTKETGEYAEGDFAIATKYTDDTVANEVASALSEVRESVTFLNGTEGGIFRPIDSNGDGINDGVIFADRTDAELPPDAKLLVINFEGIGLSGDAGNTYRTAITNDGTIEALKYHSKTIKTFYATDYTQADQDRINAIIDTTVMPTTEDYEKYDFTGGGRIDITDLLICIRLLNGTYAEYKLGWEVTIDPSNHVNAFEIKKVRQGDVEVEEPVLSVGAGAVRCFDNDIKLIPYPVGSIYMSVNSTSPAQLFGGTWARINNAFLWASDENAPQYIGYTGGEYNHTLTIDEMPSHQHDLQNENYYGSTVNWSTNGVGATSNKGFAGNVRTAPNGGGKPHNNMPPYVQVAVWKRVA